jgi:dipeptidyl-peptidase-4
VAQDGSRITFLRSRAGDDPVNCLWAIDVEGFVERLVADPRALDDAHGDLPPEERARRERAREGAGGIVAYGSDPQLRKAAFALAGELYVVDLVHRGVRRLETAGAVIDPRPDPTGARVAYVSDGQVRVVDLDGGRDAAITPEEPARAGGRSDVTWGLAEFVAAEEMGRSRGYWWSPEGDQLVVARVDNSPVGRWHISDPADPGGEPAVVRYPAAGTANAEVSVHVFGLGGSSVAVEWNREAFPYLAKVSWAPGSPLTVVVQSREQRTLQVLVVDPVSGTTDVRHEERDEAWVDLVPGVPQWTPDGKLVTTGYVDDVRRVLVDGVPVSPPGVQVTGVIDVTNAVVYSASDEPTESHVWSGATRLSDGEGVHGAVPGGDVVIVGTSTMQGSSVDVRRAGGTVLGHIQSLAEDPQLDPNVTFLRLGPRELRAGLVLPRGADPDARLPVLLDPYGGPGHRRVMRSRNAWLEHQWLADQGFAVLVADGRGTGGRGRRWDRALHRDLAGPPLDDQVDALMAAADEFPILDRDRVAIRGWSFGGFLAALAVLRRPDVFHAAVAGAPVTEWRLYDTHYTERYLGLPSEEPDAYRRSSLLDDAEKLSRPLLLIHGLADDNVVFAHTLRLSRALFEAGRDHRVVPLSGITHMTPQEVVAENLLLLQVRFLKEALASP